MNGRDAPWVLLRGLGREAGHWGDFAVRLSAALGGVRVMALDLPGCGGRREVRSPVDVGAMAQDVRLQLRALGIGGPCNVLALSLGAMVALAWLQARPHEVLQAVLINTSARDPCLPPWRRLRPRAALALLSTLALPPRAAERMIAAQTSAAVAPDVLAHWVDLRRRRPVARADALRQLVAAARWRLGGARAGVPVLLLSSALDRLVDPACTRALAAHWQAPWREHPWAGHDLPLDDPDWVVASVGRWLDRGNGAENGAANASGEAEASPEVLVGPE